MIYRKLPKTASLPVTCHPQPGLHSLFFSSVEPHILSYINCREVTSLPRKQVTKISALCLDGRSAAHNETDHKKNQKDNEQNPCNLGRGTSDAAKAQNPGNQSDDKKSNAPTQHIQFLLFKGQDGQFRLKTYLFTLACDSGLRRPLIMLASAKSQQRLRIGLTRKAGQTFRKGQFDCANELLLFFPNNFPSLFIFPRPDKLFCQTYVQNNR
jgi:hypothetical protein